METIADPDEIRRDREYPTPPPDVRHWIVTAFVARRPPKGELEWKRP